MVEFTTNNMENVLFVTKTNFNAKCTLCLGSFVEMKELDPAGASVWLIGFLSPTQLSGFQSSKDMPPLK